MVYQFFHQRDPFDSRFRRNLIFSLGGMNMGPSLLRSLRRQRDWRAITMGHLDLLNFASDGVIE